MSRFSPKNIIVAQRGFTPHILQRYALRAMLLLVLLSFASVNLQALLWQTSDWLVGTILPAVVVDLTNQERRALSAAPLQRNATLDEAARLKAEHMVQEGYFAHYSPTGVTPWHWFAEVGYPFVHAGENLAIHFSDSREVVTAWMNSPTHRDNIVDKKYLEIGVGTARGVYQGYETIFVVQLFGAPAVAPAPTPPAPAPVATAPSETSLVDTTSSAESLSTEQVAGVSEPVQASAAHSPAAPTPTPAADTPPPDPVVASSAAAETVAMVPATEVAAVEVSDEMVSMYSSMLTTSTPLLPATMGDTLSSTAGTSAPVLGRLATQPSTVLQIIYLIIGGLVGLALFTSVLLEWRRHHPLQVAYGVLLLCVMSGLFYFHAFLTSGALIA